jgi:hypothetical protein
MTQKGEDARIKKFVTLANCQFDIVSIKILFQILVYTVYDLFCNILSYSQHLKIKEDESHETNEN